MATTAESPARTPAQKAPAPHEDQAGYLRHHGWKPLGDPADAATHWLDPTKPLRDEWRQEEKFYQKLVLGDDGKPQKDAQGRDVVRTEPVMAQFGRGASEKRPVRQWVHTPAGSPLPRAAALAEQMTRDLEAQKAALKAK